MDMAFSLNIFLTFVSSKLEKMNNRGGGGEGVRIKVVGWIFFQKLKIRAGDCSGTR